MKIIEKIEENTVNVLPRDGIKSSTFPQLVCRSFLLSGISSDTPKLT